MKILVINGPNINMLGVREPAIYGAKTYECLLEVIQSTAKEREIVCVAFQSNSEGELVTRIQDTLYDGTDAIVINAAAYTHTSIAILDALKAVALPCVEVHLSNPFEREDFRRVSYTGMACEETIVGKGIDGYVEAIEYLCKKYK